MASKLLRRKDDVSAKPNHPWRLLPDGSYEMVSPQPPPARRPLPIQHVAPPPEIAPRAPSPPPPLRLAPLPVRQEQTVPLELTSYTHEDIRAIVNRNLAEAQRSYLAF